MATRAAAKPKTTTPKSCRPATVTKAAPQRLDVTKTYKLFINGAFPRSESGRTIPITGRDGQPLGLISRASRKDLRDAVVAARKAQEPWGNATAYLRGQIVYRIAEMLQARRAEFIDLLTSASTSASASKSAQSVKSVASSSSPRKTPARKPAAALAPAQEVDLAIDRLVTFAGWADKLSQLLGSVNQVAGPYYNVSMIEPTGVIVIIAPSPPTNAPPLLGLISLLAPVIVSGNTAIAIPSTAAPHIASVFAEVIATSDVPAGVVNILTGRHDDLLPILASHRDIDAILSAPLSPESESTLRTGVAENLKRITILPAGTDWTAHAALAGPRAFDGLIETKTIWHPCAM